MSLAEAGKRLGKDPRYVRGYADCLDITLESWGTSLLMTHADFERLKRCVEGPKPCAHAAAAH